MPFCQIPEHYRALNRVDEGSRTSGVSGKRGQGEWVGWEGFHELACRGIPEVRVNLRRDASQIVNTPLYSCAVGRQGNHAVIRQPTGCPDSISVS